jgi:ribosome-binding factor A
MSSFDRRRRRETPVTATSFHHIDPTIYFGDPDRHGSDRKTLQLCKQAIRALSLALAGECHDDVLRDVYVDTVTPAPDASRLLVTVRPATTQADPDLILDRLRTHRAFLRTCVAGTISRKRAPELVFCVGAPGDAP